MIIILPIYIFACTFPNLSCFQILQLLHCPLKVQVLTFYLPLLNIDGNKTKQCFSSISDSPNLSIGPPAYLSVNNFELCLRENQASPNHVEWCLPQNKPEKCVNGSWSELKNVFRGIGCPPIKVAINAGTYILITYMLIVIKSVSYRSPIWG